MVILYGNQHAAVLINLALVLVLSPELLTGN
jgi:hypothetical protein